VAIQPAEFPEQQALTVKFRFNLSQSGVNEEIEKNPIDKSLTLLKININN